jgi:hypothetical protein
MRISTCTGGLVLASLATIGWFSTQAAIPAPPAPAKAVEKASADDRDELANKLFERTTLKDPLKNITFKEALDLLSEKYEITLLVDQKSFGPGAPAAAALNADDDGVLGQPINVPAMKNVRLGTILKFIADQVDGVYLIYPDHIKFVGAARAYTLTRPALRVYMAEENPGAPPADNELESQQDFIRSIPLVTVSFNEKSLPDALKEIELRTNRSIVLANQAADKIKTTITARFTNVPVDTAVATVAEMAGLKMARKGSVLLVTTAERAKEFDPAPPSALNFGRGLLGMGDLSNGDDLKKKVAELEKAVEELKAKK